MQNGRADVWARPNDKGAKVTANTKGRPWLMENLSPPEERASERACEQGDFYQRHFIKITNGTGNSQEVALILSTIKSNMCALLASTADSPGCVVKYEAISSDQPSTFSVKLTLRPLAHDGKMKPSTPFQFPCPK